MPLQLLGGCSLNEHGVFHVFLKSGRNGERAPLDPSKHTFREFLRELYDFLMTDEPVLELNGHRIVRQMTRGRRHPPRPPLPMIKVPILDAFDLRMIRMDHSGYCVLIQEQPYLATQSGEAFFDTEQGGRGMMGDPQDEDAWEEMP